jgi:hypothetical protein
MAIGLTRIYERRVKAARFFERPDGRRGRRSRKTADRRAKPR